MSKLNVSTIVLAGDGILIKYKNKKRVNKIAKKPRVV